MDAPTEHAPDAGERVRPARRALLLAGGAFVVPALALMFGLVAVPARTADSVFGGPWLASLAPGPIELALADGREAVLEQDVVFLAPDSDYVTARAADPVFGALLREALTGVLADRPEPAVEVYAADVRAELVAAVEPLLFPLHVGSGGSTGREEGGRDARSGLAPGRSQARSTWREPFGRHHLTVDARRGRIALAGGEPVAFDGNERDLPVTAPDGRSVFLDVSALERGFRGDVAIGVQGRIVRILTRAARVR